MKNVMFLTCWVHKLLWLEFRQTLQNGFELIYMVSSKSNWTVPYQWASTSATRLPMDIDAALNILGFLRNEVWRRREKIGGDGRSTLVTRRSRDGRFPVFLYFVRRSSWLTFPGSSVAGLFL